MFTLSFGPWTTSSAADHYVPVPVTCRLVKAETAVDTVVTNANTILTFSDGTTTIGTITVGFSGCAVGDCDSLSLDSTSRGAVALGSTTPLKVALDGGGDAGAVNLTLTFSEFHSNI